MSLYSPKATAGPNDLAGFMLPPVNGIDTIIPKKTAAPIAKAAIKWDSLFNVEKITAAKKVVHTTSKDSPKIIEVINISDDKE